MKTDTKQTPGSWKADSATHRGCTYIQQPNEGDNGGWVVATCWGADRDSNARLIAAAPDLLAALVGMMNRYGDKSAFPSCDASISARAAVSKAEGEK